MFGVPKRIIFDNLDENLTHVVQGKKASDLEERFAKAVDRLSDWTYEFRVRINPLSHKLTSAVTNLPEELEIDFLCIRGATMIPILIQGEIGHFHTAWQRAIDEQKEASINSVMRNYHALPVMKVPERNIDLWRLATQDGANRLAMEILL